MSKHEALLSAHYEPGMTADTLLAKLSVEGRLPYNDALRSFRKLRTEDRLKHIRTFLKARLRAPK